jgi:hypothetical protein
MDISKRTAVILGAVTLALVLAATAWASSLPSPPWCRTSWCASGHR